MKMFNSALGTFSLPYSLLLLPKISKKSKSKTKNTHKIYGTKKITKAELYSIRSNPNSSDKPNTLALEMFTRSKNANRYKMHKKGITWRSIRRRSFWGVVLGGHDGMVSSLVAEGSSCPWWCWWSLVVVVVVVG